jgi:hypothetical protein
MKSCQDQTVPEEDVNSLKKAIMDWTTIFVRQWMHDINRSTGLFFGHMNLLLHIQSRGR